MSSLTRIAKSFLGWAEYSFTGMKYEPGELLVLNYHGTQKKFLDNFKSQLDFLDKHFSFFSPEHLESFFSGTYKSTKPSVLLTFDDGIKNNLLAAKILNERKISALFFIVPAFASAENSLQENYFRKKIRDFVSSEIDSQPEDLTAMNWAELSELTRMGHVLGAHSTTHGLIAASSDDKNSEYEIADCKKLIEEKTGTPVQSFCAPNNSLLSCDLREMKLIKENYHFFFSTIPGSNSFEKNRWFIRRSNVEVHWSKGTFLQAIGKWDRRRWEGKAGLFRRIATGM